MIIVLNLFFIFQLIRQKKFVKIGFDLSILNIIFNFKAIMILLTYLMHLISIRDLIILLFLFHRLFGLINLPLGD